LGGKKPLLPRSIEPGYEEVKADLADRHQGWIMAVRFESSLQPRQILVIGTVDIHRVNAQCIDTAGMGPGQLSDRIEIADLDRGHDDHAHARGTGRIEHRRAVRIELAGIEVAVGVDQHRALSTLKRQM
jgi:hypothetical protein